MNFIKPLYDKLFPWKHDSVIFEVTPRCNLKCLHCYNVWKDDVGYAEGELPTDDALALIDKAIDESHCKYFTFTGGEPCLREDLEQLVARAAARCKQVTIITNGTLLDDERIKSLIEAGVDLFELPLNSSDRETHNKMAGDIDCFDKVTRAAATIRYNGGKVAFVFVGTKLNIKDFKDTLDLGMALGAWSYLFNRYNAGGECHGKPEILMPEVDDVREGLRVADEYSKEYGVGIGASIAIPPCLIDPSEFANVGFGFCAAGTKRAYYTLDPLGNVRPCNHTPTVLGNLREDHFSDIVESDTLKCFMKAVPEFCSGCKLETECQGGCKAAAEACYGKLDVCEPFLELNKDRAVKL